MPSQGQQRALLVMQLLLRSRNALRDPDFGDRSGIFIGKLAGRLNPHALRPPNDEAADIGKGDGRWRYRSCLGYGRNRRGNRLVVRSR